MPLSARAPCARSTFGRVCERPGVVKARRASSPQPKLPRDTHRPTGGCVAGPAGAANDGSSDNTGEFRLISRRVCDLIVRHERPGRTRATRSLGHRHQFPKRGPARLELVGGLLDYRLWLDEDCSDHMISPLANKTSIWEHTNFAEPDAVRYILDSLDKKKDFTAEDGKGVAVVEFESLATLQAWREHPEHRIAQRQARERFFAEYRIQVCTPVRDYAFSAGETPAE